MRPWWRSPAPSPACRNRWSAAPTCRRELATRMCEWVSDALKTYIQTNYTIAPTSVDAALERSHARC